jgi:hypothetical protein
MSSIPGSLDDGEGATPSGPISTRRAPTLIGVRDRTRPISPHSPGSATAGVDHDAVEHVDVDSIVAPVKVDGRADTSPDPILASVTYLHGM